MPEQVIASPDPSMARRIVEAALEEDGAHRDVTTQALVAGDQRSSAVILAESAGVLAGLDVAAQTFAILDSALKFERLIPEGAVSLPGASLARVSGSLAPILSGERVALNFLQRLSGIATATRRMVDAVAGLPVRIVDTRKTTPGLRTLERYAVRVGGGQNHRFSLADGILIKDNHLAAARLRGRSIAATLTAVRQAAPHTMRIEIEVTTIAEALEALGAGADVLLLDNMPVNDMRTVVEQARSHGDLIIEASGRITLENVRMVAETGVDIISVGSLTHSPTALDMSLEVEID